MKRRFLLIILAVAALQIFHTGCRQMCARCGHTIKVTILQGVQFDFNRYAIKPEGKVLLDQDVELLKKDATLDISVEGHCDMVGSDDYNQKLSERRAQTVADYFKANGIDAGRMRTVGFGRKKPLVPNDTEANRAKNRRVEVHVIKARP